MQEDQRLDMLAQMQAHMITTRCALTLLAAGRRVTSEEVMTLAGRTVRADVLAALGSTIERLAAQIEADAVGLSGHAQ